MNPILMIVEYGEGGDASVMSILYNKEHSITFFRADHTYTRYSEEEDFTRFGSGAGRNTWYDFCLVPLKRPSIEPHQPRLKLINIPGSNKQLDLTESYPGGLTHERSTGQWQFYVDTDHWVSWSIAKQDIEDFINGRRLYCILEDDHSTAYVGNFTIDDWQNGPDYPIVTIGYDIDCNSYTHSFDYDITANVRYSYFVDSSHIVYVGDELESLRPYIHPWVYTSDLKGIRINDFDLSFTSNEGEGGTFDETGYNQYYIRYYYRGTRHSFQTYADVQPFPET